MVLSNLLRRYGFITGLCAVMISSQTSTAAKLEKTGNDYILSNDYLSVKISPEKGGGITELVYLPGQFSLNPPGRVSMNDNLYVQKKTGDNTVVDIEEETTRRFNVVGENTDKNEVSLSLSISGQNESFAGIDIIKKYSLKAGSSALYVDYILRNKGKKEAAAGLWTRTFFRMQYDLPEKSIFYTPSEKGLQVITHPGKDATSEKWSINPSAPWHAVTGTDGNGIAVLLDDRHISDFYDWYRNIGFESTLEWLLREQQIPPGGEFSTSIVLMPLKGMETVSDIIPGSIAAGIGDELYLLSASGGEFTLQSGSDKKTINLKPSVAEKIKLADKSMKFSLTDKDKNIFAFENGKFLRKNTARLGNACLIPQLYVNPTAQNIKTQYLPVSSGKTAKMPDKDYMDITIPRALCDGFYEAVLDFKLQDTANISVCRLDKDGKPESNYQVPCKYKAEGDHGKVVFMVKGIGAYAYGMKVINGRYSRDNKDLGSAEESYRIYFKNAPVKKSDATNIPDSANLISYGSFENIDPKTGWPAGMPEYFIKISVTDGYTISTEETPFGKNCIKLVKPAERDYAAITFHCAVKGGKNYYFGYAEKYDTMQETYTAGSVYWYDCDGKNISNENFNVIKKSFDWKDFGKVLKAPDNAVFAIMTVIMRTSDGSALLKNVVIRPQIYSGSEIDQERARIKQVSYTPLDIFEQMDGSYVTPHVKWLKPSVSKAPSVLFLIAQHRTVSDTHKREVIELTQRMSMSKFHYIPILQKMLTPANPVELLGMMGGDTYSEELEPYTLMSIKDSDPSKYDITFVYNVNFKGKQKGFTDLLLDTLKKGKGLVLLDCSNIPDELKGSQLETPSGFFLIPEMRKLPSDSLKNICSLGKIGEGRVAIVNKNDFNSTKNLRLYPCVPQEYSQLIYHDYYGQSFPYWEYMYIPLIKAVEWAASCEAQASFAGFSEDASKNSMSFAIKSAADITASLKIAFSSIWKEKGPEITKEITLHKGENKINVPLPAELSGGINIVDYQLLAADGKIYDFGAGKVNIPETCSIREMTFSNADLCYKNNENVSLKVLLDKVPAEAEVQCEVKDTNNRVVWRNNQKAAAETVVSFKLNPPYTIIYKVFVKIILNGKTLASGLKEFSMPFADRDTKDLQAYVWGPRPGTYLRWRELGFDSMTLGFGDSYSTDGLFAAMAAVNLRPHTIGSGEILNPADDKYLGDRKSDPVRKPCYSDMERWGKVRNIIHGRLIKGNYRFYGVTEHFLADESHLGRSVCYSEYCLKDFRKYLQERYVSLDNLNKEWNTDFKSWDAVMPVQSEEVDIKNKNNMARWLDHKIFMNRVFAFNSVGLTKKYIQEIVPGSKVGMSGTQNPGFSYDWSQLMKVIDFLASYGGIQTDLIHSFSLPGTISGQWCGGYVPAHQVREEYERSMPWAGIFMDSNAYMFYHGSGGTCFYGDLSVSKNLQIVSEELRELKGGTAKMLLSAKSEEVQTAIFHSQASMFAAMETVGYEFWGNSLLSWKTLLNDLKYNFCFINEEELEKGGLDNKKFKLLILPAALCISPAQTENICKFVSNGGLVIADFGTGYFDGSGKRVANKKLDALFGVDRQNSMLEIGSCEEHIKATAEFGIPGTVMKIWTGEKNFKLAGGKNLADSNLRDIPLMVQNKFGKGGSFLLNTPINWYKDVKLGGAGGELTQASTGPQKLSESLRNIVSGILTHSDMQPLCKITVAGKTYPCATVFKQDGPVKYFGLIKESIEKNIIDVSAAVEASVALPFKAHIYNVRNGSYIGYTDKFQTRIIPALAQLYALLPYKVTGIELNCKDEYARGEEPEIQVKMMVSEGKSGPHVMHLELQDPSGKTVPCYSQNIHLADGTGTLKFQFAYNDQPGKWKLTVRDVASSVSVQKIISLK